MALMYWWMVPLLVLAAAAVAYAVWRRRGSAQPTLVAHAERLTALPEYHAALAKRRHWMRVGVAGVVLLLLSLALAAARPVSVTSSTPEKVNRDIMLCLDVSGSMISTDAAIVDVFSQLVTGFKGERIGLVIFDSSAVTVFPLTDDYDFVAEQLGTAKDALEDGGGYEFFSGTFESPGSSLIGDGLASCATGFPDAGTTQRSRSIILATDNMLAGKPLFSLAEAAALTQEKKIRIYTLNPNDFGEIPLFGDSAEGLRKASSQTGGAYFALDDRQAVAQIVKQVQSTEAARMKGAPQKSILDQPGWALGGALAALMLLGASLWRLRR